MIIPFGEEEIDARGAWLGMGDVRMRGTFISIKLYCQITSSSLG